MATKGKTDQQLKEELQGLQHAMQSGVAMEMAYDDSSTDRKNLRVGINSVHVFHGALAKLLVDKGIITNREYLEAMVAGMRDEVNRYEKLLSDLLRRSVKLG